MKYLIGFILLIPIQSFGYIEMGTGSYFIQIFFAFFLSSIFLLKAFWKKIIAFFRRSKENASEKKNV